MIATFSTKSNRVNMAAQDEVDVCESWEDMDEIGLDQKIKLMSSLPSATTLKSCKVTNVIVEDSACIGSQCIMPEPAIRILKRPSSTGNGQLNGENRARPVKTLEQRQKEYEQARLRILGEARSPEDVIDDNLSRLQDKLQANNLNESKAKNCQNETKVKERKVLARIPGASGIFPSPPPPGVLVIRTPRGPDGTKGFVRR
ncbi:SUZ domain-containing protein 1 [Pieris napi]|nr:SUZ domain-containing protein 1 [Pieris napi]